MQLMYVLTYSFWEENGSLLVILMKYLGVDGAVDAVSWIFVAELSIILYIYTKYCICTRHSISTCPNLHNYTSKLFEMYNFYTLNWVQMNHLDCLVRYSISIAVDDKAVIIGQ